MAPSFISQLITSKAVPGSADQHGGGSATPTQQSSSSSHHHAPTGNSRTNHYVGGSPSLPPGFAGMGGGIGGIGASPGIGGGARLPMRSNLGLPMSLQMPLNFANVNSNANGNGNGKSNLPPSMMPMIPNMKRTVSKEYQTESESTSSSSSVSPTSSSSSSSTTANANGKSWNDAQKMEDFFLHIKDPEQFMQAENKLVNIRDLVAKNSSPLDRFEAQHSRENNNSSTSSSSSTPRKQPQQQQRARAAAMSPPQDGGGRTNNNNALLSEMLASRSNSSSNGMTTPSKPKASERSNQDDNNDRRPQQQQKRAANEDGRSNLLAEMLAKRGGAGQEEKQPARQQRAEPSGGDSRSNMLTEMLAKRGGQSDAPKSSPKAVKPPSSGGDARSNMLGEMLARRGGGGAPPSSPPQEESVKKGGKRQALADMLSKRIHSSPQSKAGDDSPKSKDKSSNPLAAMLKRRFPKSDKSEEESASNPQEPQKESPAEASQQEDQTPLKDHPDYMSYFKMLKIGHPAPVVKHKMQRDGHDPAILDMDPNKPLPASRPGQGGGDSEFAETEAEFEARLAEYKEKSTKYTQMLKVGLPRPVVEHKMQMEGVDVAWLDGPPARKKSEKQAVAAAPAPPTEAEIAAHRAKYDKYFAMLRVGLPRGAVEHKMQMAGIDPKELDGPHPVATPAVTSAAPGSGANPAIKNFKRSNSIRKKLHWEVKRNTLHNSSRESLWNFSIADDDDGMSDIQISNESKEMLEKLFVKTISDTKKKPVAKKDADAASGDDKKKPMIVLIDMKKSQNIAITLARVKMAFPELKREILAMNPTVLSTAQLQSLMDMWPDRKEQEAIDNFHGDFALLGTTEKFLVETRNIPRFKEKLACLVFKQEFPGRVHELRESINLIIRGVHQVCSSLALRRLFIYILQIGNLLNFGTESAQNAAVGGFSLSSLVKLSQTKAFVGGITFLHYVVQSIERDVPQLARFYDQINLISKCSKVSLNALLSEKKSLDDGLKSLQHEAQVDIPTGDADAELAMSILKHFATEVEHELEALDDLMDQMNESKSHFLEYFEEEETGEELDVLLGHISNFTVEYRREHKKYLEAKRQEKLKEQKQQAQALRHSMSASPARPPQSRQARHSHHGLMDYHGKDDKDENIAPPSLQRSSTSLVDPKSYQTKSQLPPPSQTILNSTTSA